MKKLLLSILFVLFSILLFAQPTYLRGYKTYFGTPSQGSNTTWNTSRDSNLLIKIDGSHITIYSETQQDIHTTGMISEVENQSKWFALDQDGKKCHLYLGYESSINSTYLMVEYTDLIVCIYTKTEE